MSGPIKYDPKNLPAFLFDPIAFANEATEAWCKHDPGVEAVQCEPCMRALVRCHLDSARLEVLTDDLYGPDSPYAADSAVEQLAALELALLPVGVAGTQATHRIGEWQEPPRWPSRVTYIDSAQGGFTGVTAIAGTEGIGKSLLAHSSAVSAAIDGWAVFYLNAEMSRDELNMRWDAYEKVYPEAAKARLRFWRVDTPRGFKIEDFVAFMQEEVARFTYQNGPGAWPDNCLVVLDSINTIAKLRGGNYMEALDHLGMWCMQARKVSRGRVAFLVIGEQNVRGGIKGEQLNYWADIYLLMTRNKEHPQFVDFEVRKARQGPSQSPVAHELNYPERCFDLAPEEFFSE